jgi:hypothetical protein
VKLTNRMGLPEPLVDAVRNDSYSRGGANISVTGLLKPPRQSALETSHQDEITEDASERIWSLCGQVIHGILERANRSHVAERRLSIQVEGWSVSGSMDLYHQSGKLQDYKFVTAYKFKNGSVPIEYEQQLNIYAEILRQNGEAVSSLEIVGILRDWSKLEAARDPAYPQSQVIILPVTLWTPEKARLFIRNRVVLHQQARRGDLPECSPEERWAKPTVYAVMKVGRKTAVKLYDNERDAQSHASVDSSLQVQVRPGESIRCRFYCAVSKFCTQYTKSKEPVAAESEIA